MRAAALRSIVTVQRRVQMGVDSHNQPNMVWQNWRAGIFCERTSKRGREHFDQQSKQRLSEVVYQFYMRQRVVTGVDPTMRFVEEDGSTYDIRSILPTNDRVDEVVIECTLQNAALGGGALQGAIADTPPAGIANTVYAGFTIEATGGFAPYTFDVVGTPLPAGLVINGSSGAVSGTPTVAGSTDITFRVHDADGDEHVLPAVTIVVS